jgi:hypothetical protein
MENIEKMIDAIGTDTSGKWMSRDKVIELVSKIQDQHYLANRNLSYQLLGVIIDTEEGSGFDGVCLNTVKRVHNYLANGTTAD